MMPLDTDNLAELIRRKHDCLVELQRMGDVQLRLVREGRISELLDVLSAKQRVLGRLQAIERCLTPFRPQDPQRRTWRTSQARQECADRLARCETLLAEIAGQEKQCEQELIRGRDEAAAQLQEVHLAGQARGAYVAHASQRPRAIDLLSED